MLDVHPATLGRWVKSGLIESVQEDGQTRYTLAEIERDDTWTDADEAQHLLRLAAQIVRPVGRRAIGA